MMFIEHIVVLMLCYNFISAFSDSLSIISPPDSEVKLRGLSSGLGSAIHTSRVSRVQFPLSFQIPKRERQRRLWPLWWPWKQRTHLNLVHLRSITLYIRIAVLSRPFWEFPKNKIKALCVNCIIYSLLLFLLLTLLPTPNAGSVLATFVW